MGVRQLVLSFKGMEARFYSFFFLVIGHYSFPFSVSVSCQSRSSPGAPVAPDPYMGFLVAQIGVCPVRSDGPVVRFPLV